MYLTDKSFYHLGQENKQVPHVHNPSPEKAKTEQKELFEAGLYRKTWPPNKTLQAFLGWQELFPLSLIHIHLLMP